jgi:LacI family transcriptional regulator
MLVSRRNSRHLSHRFECEAGIRQTLAMQDDEIAEVLRYSRDRGPFGIAVTDLLKTFSISRRRLDECFRAERNRIRMAHVGRLLLDSDRPVATIAAEAGFTTGASLSQAFCQHFDTTPGVYRRRKRVT